MNYINKILSGFKWTGKIAKKHNIKCFHILNDFYKMRRKNKIGPIEYENFSLYKQNKNFRESFLSHGERNKYLKLLNPSYYACLARDKYLSHLLLKQAGIPTPELIAYYNPESGYNCDIIVNDIESLVEKLISYKKINSGIIVKPAKDGEHGHGVKLFYDIKKEGNKILLVEKNGNCIDLKEIVGNTPLLFEERVKQSNQFSSFNKSSVNTVRIMTTLYPNHEAKIIAAFLKIGREGSPIDNAGNGGNIDCGIDCKTGITYNTLQFNSWEEHFHVESHPDSKAIIDNIKIDNWDLIISKLKDFQARIPQLKAIGWDVAVTETGPVIIEINNWWDSTGQLFIDRGWKKEIKDCFEAWQLYQLQNP